MGAKSFNATCGSMDATVTGENPIGVPSKNPTGWIVVPKFSGNGDFGFPLDLTGEKIILFSKLYITVFLAAPFVVGKSLAISSSNDGERVSR